MDNETGGHNKTGGFQNVDMAKNGKNQLDGTYIERRSVNIGRRGKISYIHNQSKTKKLEGTPAERRLSSERNNGGKKGGEERGRGRPRQKLLDWMMSEGYGKLKEEAQNREKWSHRTSGPARGQRT